jgi:hypothetical protein
VDSSGVDGADGGLGVGIRGEEDTARVRIDITSTLEHFDASHSGHALVADYQSDGFFARFELGQRVERGGPAGGPHDPVGFAIFAAQILDDGLKDAYVIVNRQQDRSRHKKSVVPESGLIPQTGLIEEPLA